MFDFANVLVKKKINVWSHGYPFLAGHSIGKYLE